jgi:hypothetical protein
MRRKNMKLATVVMGIAFLFSLTAFAQDPAAKTDAPKPADTVTPPEAPKPPEVGVGAAAPGSHQGVIPTVSTQWGSLTILGVFQTLFDNTINIKNYTGPELTKSSFDFQRARIILKGHVISESLTYNFQGEAKNAASFALDAFLGYKCPTSGLAFRVGRFVPDFSYMMPRNTADLGTINYPLYLTGASGFGVWRQMGLDVASTMGDLPVKVGVFNGMPETPPAIANPLNTYMEIGTVPLSGAAVTASNATDNNRDKDYMARISYKLKKELSLDLNLYLGMPPNTINAKRYDLVFMGGPGVEYNDGKLHLVGEFMFRNISFGNEGAADAITSFGAWAHAGYRFTDLIEGVFRVDVYEPNMDNDNDMLMRLTAGPNFWLEDKHFRILVNAFLNMPMETATGSPNRPWTMGLQAQFAALW